MADSATTPSSASPKEKSESKSNQFQKLKTFWQGKVKKPEKNHLYHHVTGHILKVEYTGQAVDVNLQKQDNWLEHFPSGNLMMERCPENRGVALIGLGFKINLPFKQAVAKIPKNNNKLVDITNNSGKQLGCLGKFHRLILEFTDYKLAEKFCTKLNIEVLGSEEPKVASREKSVEAIAVVKKKAIQSSTVTLTLQETSIGGKKECSEDISGVLDDTAEDGGEQLSYSESKMSVRNEREPGVLYTNSLLFFNKVPQFEVKAKVSSFM